MKTIIKITFAALAFVSFSQAQIFSDCMKKKRFSREMEFNLMKHCVGNDSYMNEYQYEQKVKDCVCFVGSLACEYDGDDEKLNRAAEKGALEKNDKKYRKCLEANSDK